MPENLEKRLKRQIHGKLHRFTAIVPLGFEATLVKELQQIGIAAENDSFETTDGKVIFTAKITEAWKAVAHSRIANRVLMDIASFKAENFRELEKKAAEIPWEFYFDERTIASSLQTNDERNNPSISELVTSNSLHIHVTCKHSRLYHSDAVAERFYDVFKGGSLPLATTQTARLNSINESTRPPRSRQHDSLRRVAFGSLTTPQQSSVSATPSAGTPRNTPPQNIYVSLLNDRCTVSLDLAGEELYKRGHQRFVNDAPLKETIAAAMLFEAFEQMQSSITLIDPMAGGGTFSLEAAYMTSGLIPGKCRDFALKHQPAFKETTWNYLTRVILSGDAARDPGPNPAICIHTSDISDKAVEIIKHNVEVSPLPDGCIKPEKRDFFSYTPEEIAKLRSESQAVIVLNPPYGKRLDANAPKLYANIGRKLSEFKGYVIAILAPKGACTENLLKNCAALSLPSTKVIKTSHGGISLNCFIGKIC
ncbi:MAG: RNA methyltransferase [Fibrobacter sp.]|nr:RNA methyltransferase [Fibrobacter sp.]